MPKMIVSIDGVVIKEVQLTKERTTLGRRPYNDVVIDNLAVSGEHAALQMNGSEVVLEDLNSTNGTYVNGKAIKKQALQNGDTIEVGKYKIKFVNEAEAPGFDKTMLFKPGESPAGLASVPEAAALNASLRVLSGTASGREVPLTKAVTTVGKPGVAVASISRRAQGYVVAHVEGSGIPLLNGAPISSEPVALKSGDMIELAGTRMQFIQN
ncbi:MAG: FHA domain-containing protein [Burkholderiaceae bacterium]|jgi:pSer/pThr/pTyr-binding forkhead associated (FHA) protein|uniref:FHA domain-containing protein n=1 Tax=Hylemonella sp. TaxID=2066020 RepID=UPI0035B38B11|nr:FHA domain-containing protein [Burkholderiaceae bacterium]